MAADVASKTSIEKAVDLLGPFAIEGVGKPRKRRSDAIAAVQAILDLYREAKHREANGSRVGDTCAELEEIEKAIRVLEILFNERKSLVRNAIDVQALAGGYRTKLAAFFDHCNSSLAAPDGLRLLLGAARDARQTLAWIDGTGDISKPDRGGRFSLYTDWNGSPRRRLITHCAFAYGDFHGAETVNDKSKGDFQKFIVAIWKAAGEAGEELSPRILSEELHSIVVAVKPLLGKPVLPPGHTRAVFLAAFAAGIRPPDDTGRDN